MIVLEYESETESDESGCDPVVKTTLESVTILGEDSYQLQFQLQTDLEQDFVFHFMVSDGVEVVPSPEVKSLRNGDKLPVKVTGSGLFKIFIMWPSTRENVFQQGYALARNSFSKEFQDVTLSSVSRHTIHSPELIFAVDKINRFGNTMQRVLVMSLQGVKNFRDNGKCSSVTRWSDIKSAVDKVDQTVHITQDDGYLRVYKSPLSQFMALCLKTYHKRVESRRARLKNFGA